MAKLRCLTTYRLEWCVLLIGFTLLFKLLSWRSGDPDNLRPVYRDRVCNYTSAHIVSGYFQSKHHCPEETHIVYIKVPKTGSGTISSILINFGRIRRLTFALSKHGNHYGMEPVLPENIAPIARGKHYDLLVQHSTFNHTTITNVFPPDTVIFASIREPFSHFVSSFYFYRFQKLLPQQVQRSSNETLKIITFINSGYRKLQSTPLDARTGKIIYNRLSLRMGVPFKHSLDADFVREYIDTVLDPKLDLVLVQEYFDESLVLLKRRLCWSFRDIIYLPYHIQTNTGKQFAFSSTILSRHKQLAVAEYIIYDHFYSKFWKTVLEEGVEFFEEVRAFRIVQNQVRSFCALAPDVQKTLVISFTKWSDAFEITGQKCVDMQVLIRSFVHHRRIEQMAELDRQYMKITV